VCSSDLFPSHDRGSEILNWKNPTERELIKQLGFLSISYVLILSDGKVIFHKAEESNATVCLKIVQLEKTLHCQLVMPASIHFSIKRTPSITMDNAINDKLTQRMEELGDYCQKLLLHDSETIYETMRNIDENSINVEERLSRMSSQLQLVEVLIIEDKPGWYLVTGTSRLSNDALYITNDTMTAKPAVIYAIVVSDRTLLCNISLEPVSTSTLTLFRVRTDVAMQRRVEARKTIGTIPWVFINQESKRNNTDKQYINCRVISKEAVYNLIVNNVDNQQHHKFNAQFIVAKSRKFVLPKMTTEKQFTEVFMSDKNCLLWDYMYLRPTNEVTGAIQHKYLQLLAKVKPNQTMKWNSNWYVRIDKQTVNNQLGQTKDTILSWRDGS